MRKFFRTHAPVLAFAVLAIFGGVAIQESASGASATLYHTQLEGCARQNQIRTDLNRHVPAYNEQKDFVRILLVRAGRTDLVSKLDREVNFAPIPLIDCKKVIKKP